MLRNALILLMFSVVIGSNFNSPVSAQNRRICLDTYLCDHPSNPDAGIFWGRRYTYSNICYDGDEEWVLVPCLFSEIGVLPQQCDSCQGCETSNLGCRLADDYDQEEDTRSNALNVINPKVSSNYQFKRNRNYGDSYVADESIVMIGDRFFRLQEYRSKSDERLVTARAGYEIPQYSGPLKDIDSKHLRLTKQHLDGMKGALVNVHVGADRYVIRELSDTPTN